MKTSPAHSAHAEHYFVPQPSLYPVILSAGMFLLALGFIS
jgi:cytochrome c oxidase subunit 3